MKTDQLESQIAELMAWKARQEQDQADRLTGMHNAICEIFAIHHATISEIQAVLKMVELETASNFVLAQHEKAAALAAVKEPLKKEYPAKIKSE